MPQDVDPCPPRVAALATKPDAERCLQRIEAWYHQAVIDRPPVRFYRHNAQYDAGQPLDRSRWPSFEARWMDTQHQVETFVRSLEGKVFRAETFPVFVPKLGPSVYSAFYGGRLEFAEVTSWYEPVIADFDDLSALAGNPLKSRYFLKMEELTVAGITQARDRFWVGYPDLHPSLDCVAAWSGAELLLETMAIEPEKLAPVLELSISDFHPIFDHFHDLIAPHGHPSVTWLNIPCLGKFHVPSCDTGSMISPAHFNHMVLPLLRREMQGMDRAVYHVDGKGVAQHLDTILAQPDIQAIQWVQGVGNDWPILQWIPLLKRILASGRSVIVDVPLEELDDFIARMPREGVFLCLGVADAEQEDVLRRVTRW